MNCEFCGKTFKSNKTLSNHKSSSLSCSQKHKQKELSISSSGDVKETISSTGGSSTGGSSTGGEGVKKPRLEPLTEDVKEIFTDHNLSAEELLKKLKETRLLLIKAYTELDIYKELATRCGGVIESIAHQPQRNMYNIVLISPTEVDQEAMDKLIAMSLNKNNFPVQKADEMNSAVEEIIRDFGG
jgi:hypothetical protein